MKTIVIVFTFAVCIVANPRDTYHRVTINEKFKSTCIDEFHIDTDRKKDVKIHQIGLQDMTMEDKCYMSCMLKRSGIIDENGHFNVNRISDMSDNVLLDVIPHSKRCERDFSKNNCESAVKVLDCINQAMKEMNSAKLVIIYEDV